MQPYLINHRSLATRHLLKRRKSPHWRKCWFELLESRALMAADLAEGELQFMNSEFVDTTADVINTNVVNLSSTNANLNVVLNNETNGSTIHNDIGDRLVLRVESRSAVGGNVWFSGKSELLNVSFDPQVVTLDGLAMRDKGGLAAPAANISAPNVLTYDLFTGHESPLPTDESAVLEIPFRVTGDGEPQFVVSLAPSTETFEHEPIFDDRGSRTIGFTSDILDLDDSIVTLYMRELSTGSQPVSLLLGESRSLDVGVVGAVVSGQNTLYVTPAALTDGWPMPLRTLPLVPVTTSPRVAEPILPASPPITEISSELPLDTPPDSSPAAGVMMLRLAAPTEDSTDPSVTARQSLNWVLSVDATWNRFRLLEVSEGDRRRSSRTLALTSRLLDGDGTDQSLIARAIHDGQSTAVSETLGSALKRRLSLSSRISRLIDDESEEAPRVIIMTPEDFDAVLAAWGQSEPSADPKKETETAGGGE